MVAAVHSGLFKVLVTYSEGTLLNEGCARFQPSCFALAAVRVTYSLAFLVATKYHIFFTRIDCVLNEILAVRYKSC